MVSVRVERRDGGHRPTGTWTGTAGANALRAHLEARAFAPTTVRAYAQDLVTFARSTQERPIDLVDFRRAGGAGAGVLLLRRSGAVSRA